jgi:hypothetical protein
MFFSGVLDFVRSFVAPAVVDVDVDVANHYS